MQITSIIQKVTGNVYVSHLNDIYHDAANSHDTATSMILFTFNTKSLNTAMISEPIRIQQSLHKCQSQLWKLDHTRMGAIRNYKGLISFCCVESGVLSLLLFTWTNWDTTSDWSFKALFLVLTAPSHNISFNCLVVDQWSMGRNCDKIFVTIGVDGWMPGLSSSLMTPLGSLSPKMRRSSK